MLHPEVPSNAIAADHKTFSFHKQGSFLLVKRFYKQIIHSLQTVVNPYIVVLFKNNSIKSAIDHL